MTSLQKCIFDDVVVNGSSFVDNINLYKILGNGCCETIFERIFNE